MFEGANIGGDTMAEILGHLFRLPPEGKPMTIMQLAGFPAEVVDSVVSVLCRMAFDFGLWSDGVAPLLFVCEEAHRYAPADKKIGFGPTRRALSRIAKEGRKYGVFLGLVTQRPAEIDPTIISQCSTLFCMRLSNEHDQALIRSAVSDAAAKSFVVHSLARHPRSLHLRPGRGGADAHAFQPDSTEKFRPNSEAAGNTRSDAGTYISGDLDLQRHRALAQRQHEPPRQATTNFPITARRSIRRRCSRERRRSRQRRAGRRHRRAARRCARACCASRLKRNHRSVSNRPPPPPVLPQAPAAMPRHPAAAPGFPPKPR